MFSNKSRFCLWPQDGRSRVRRRRSESRFLEFAVETERALTSAVMFRNGISLGSRTSLVFLQNQLNSEIYCNDKIVYGYMACLCGGHKPYR